MKLFVSIFIFLAATILVGLTGLSQARAEKLLVVVESGPIDSAVLGLLERELALVGFTVQPAQSSLEDAALLVGCDPAEPDCLDVVAAVGDAQGLLVLPSDAKGELIVRRNGANQNAPMPAMDVASWRATLEPLLGVSWPAAESSEAEVAPSSDPVTNTEDTTSTAHAKSSSTRGAIKTRSWIVLGSGVAATSVGLIFLGVASSKQDSVDSHPTETVDDLESLRDLEDSGKSFTAAGNIFLIGGGLALAAGAGLVLWDMRSTKEDQSSLVLLPSVQPSTLGVTLQWSSL